MKNEKPRITLCAITGNCEQDVERWLDSFQPWVDEIVMVRAVGNQKADRTLEIAKDRGCVVGEYRNKKDWPHVDDFSAARNAALDIATGDWCMWADMDDLCEGGENIRALVESAHPDQWLISCPYIVSEQGVIANYRERLWRNNGKFRWVNAIHENLWPTAPMPRPAMPTDALRIIHRPGEHKGCTQDRNLRILESIPENERAVAHKFYLTQEYIRRGDAKAIDSAKQFLLDPKSNTPERFELHMALAQMADDYAAKANFYLQAWTEDPSRAEPLYELAALSLACDRPENALAYAEKMMVCKWPENPCWNHRQMFYGFWRKDLYWQCLRAIGDVFSADILRHNAAIETGKPIISLIHATRGRPELATKTRQKWIRSANTPERIQHIFVADVDDESSAILSRFPSAFMATSNGPVAAWNYGASIAQGEILIQLSDDWEPFAGWDDAIIGAIGNLDEPAVLAVNDGQRTDDLLCMAIMTRARYRQQGYMFHPEFFSMFSDNWFSERAWADGVVIDARNRITFQHIHPASGKTDWDETYARSNDRQHYERGAATLGRLQSGIKTASDIKGWCDYRLFYQAVAARLPDGGKFAEVGSWMGQSIILLAQELQNLGKSVTLYCIDTWKGEQNQPTHLAEVAKHGGSILPAFRANIEAAGVADMIKIIQADSAETAALFQDGELDGCFIDAAHDYESASRDIAAWHPKVKPNGIWAGHDYPDEQVARAIHEHADAHGYSVTGVGRVWLKTPSNQ